MIFLNSADRPLKKLSFWAALFSVSPIFSLLCPKAYLVSLCNVRIVITTRQRTRKLIRTEWKPRSIVDSARLIHLSLIHISTAGRSRRHCFLRISMTNLEKVRIFSSWWDWFTWKTHGSQTVSYTHLEKVLLTGEPSLFLFTFADINIIAGRYGKAFRS